MKPAELSNPDSRIQHFAVEPSGMARVAPFHIGPARAAAVWCVLVVSGLWIVWIYDLTPGAGGNALSTWPSESSIRRDSRPTLLLFAHPKCPCTRASLTELGRLLAVCGEKVNTCVLMAVPQDADESWWDSRNTVQARRLQDVNVHKDVDRYECRLFAAETSGECRLYSPEGRLVFCGGITASRGHEGDNNGRRAIQAYLTGQKPTIDSTYVYGCPLFESDFHSR